MSAFATKRTSTLPRRMSAFGGKADICNASSNVRLSLKTGFPGRRHILSKFGIKPFARCRASSLRRQRLHTGPDGPTITVRAFFDATPPDTPTARLDLSEEAFWDFLFFIFYKPISHIHAAEKSGGRFLSGPFMLYMASRVKGVVGLPTPPPSAPELGLLPLAA